MQLFTGTLGFVLEEYWGLRGITFGLQVACKCARSRQRRENLLGKRKSRATHLASSTGGLFRVLEGQKCGRRIVH